jgi:hypothetical protein
MVREKMMLDGSHHKRSRLQSKHTYLRSILWTVILSRGWHLAKGKCPETSTDCAVMTPGIPLLA